MSETPVGKAERLAKKLVEVERDLNSSPKDGAYCRLCSKCLGARDRIDGTYVWPEGFEHYLREHGVRPPEEFVRHVLSRCKVGVWTNSTSR